MDPDSCPLPVCPGACACLSCPRSKSFDLGQFERFRRIMHIPAYRPLLNHEEVQTLSTLQVGDPAVVQWVVKQIRQAALRPLPIGKACDKQEQCLRRDVGMQERGGSCRRHTPQQLCGPASRAFRRCNAHYITLCDAERAPDRAPACCVVPAAAAV